MSREQLITAKEVAMLLFGVLLSVLGAFQAYVIKDMSDDMKDLKVSIMTNEARNIAEFDNISKAYVMKDQYTAFERSVREDITYLKQLYFRKEEEND